MARRALSLGFYAHAHRRASLVEAEYADGTAELLIHRHNALAGLSQGDRAGQIQGHALTLERGFGVGFVHGGVGTVRQPARSVEHRRAEHLMLQQGMTGEGVIVERFDMFGEIGKRAGGITIVGDLRQHDLRPVIETVAEPVRLEPAPGGVGCARVLRNTQHVRQARLEAFVKRRVGERFFLERAGVAEVGRVKVLEVVVQDRLRKRQDGVCAASERQVVIPGNDHPFAGGAAEVEEVVLVVGVGVAGDGVEQYPVDDGIDVEAAFEKGVEISRRSLAQFGRELSEFPETFVMARQVEPAALQLAQTGAVKGAAVG